MISKRQNKKECIALSLLGDEAENKEKKRIERKR
jgi:hypothetical protein